jgi:hypothetical protein
LGHFTFPLVHPTLRGALSEREREQICTFRVIYWITPTEMSANHHRVMPNPQRLAGQAVRDMPRIGILAFVSPTIRPPDRPCECLGYLKVLTEQCKSAHISRASQHVAHSRDTTARESFILDAAAAAVVLVEFGRDHKNLCSDSCDHVRQRTGRSNLWGSF